MTRRQEKSRAAPRPIIRHPLFPAIVALWFATLCGLGLLILPEWRLQALVALSGIAAVVPAAAPPLGNTARALAAIGMALLGGGFGYLLARRILAGQPAGKDLALEAPLPAPAPDQAIEQSGETPDPEPVQSWFARLRGTQEHAGAGVPEAVQADHEPDEHEPAARSEETAAPAEALQPDPAASWGDGPAAGPARPASLRLRYADTPLEELGIVELAERLGMALRRRRAAQGEAGELPAGVSRLNELPQEIRNGQPRGEPARSDAAEAPQQPQQTMQDDMDAALLDMLEKLRQARGAA